MELFSALEEKAIVKFLNTLQMLPVHHDPNPWMTKPLRRYGLRMHSDGNVGG